MDLKPGHGQASPRQTPRIVLIVAVILVVLVGCSGSVEITAAVPDTPVVERISFELVPPELQTSCGTDGEVADLDVLEDRVVFSGEFVAVIDGDGTRHEQANVAACTHEGEFIEFGHGIDGLVRVAQVYEDMLLVGGNFTVEGSSRENFVALDLETGDVVDFGPTEIAGSVHAISFGDDTIYIAGAFSSVDGVNRTGLVRLESDGTFDSGFFPRMTRTDDEGRARVVYAVFEDGNRVYIGGDYGTLNGEPVPGVGAVDTATGLITTGFSPDLIDTNPVDSRVQVRSIGVKDEWVYLCGDWWTTEGRGDGDEQRNFGRFNRGGEADPTLEPWTDGGIRDCEFVGDDLITLGGHFDVVSEQQLRKLALVSLDTGEVIEVMGANSNKGVQAVGFTDGVMYIGGTFTRIRGVDQSGLAAIRVAEPLAE